MSVNINADTTTGLELTSDTSGNINIQNDGTTVVAVTSSGAAVTGNLTVDTDTLYVDGTNNRVGVGTTSPTGNLDIASSSNVNVYIRQTTGVCNTRIKSDSTNAAIGTSTNHQFSLLQNNTEGLTIDTSQNLKFNSGYGSVATAYGCRAWVNFNGTGTVAIRASGNVSSITDNGTGNYTVNFTTAMPDANYATNVTNGLAANSGLGPFGAAVDTQTTQTTALVRISTSAFSSFADGTVVNVAVFR